MQQSGMCRKRTNFCLSVWNTRQRNPAKWAPRSTSAQGNWLNVKIRDTAKVIWPRSEFVCRLGIVYRKIEPVVPKRDRWPDFRTIFSDHIHPILVETFKGHTAWVNQKFWTHLLIILHSLCETHDIIDTSRQWFFGVASGVVSDRFGMGFSRWSLMREVGVFDPGFWGCGRGKFGRDAITDEGGGRGGGVAVWVEELHLSRRREERPRVIWPQKSVYLEPGTAYLTTETAYLKRKTAKFQIYIFSCGFRMFLISSFVWFVDKIFFLSFVLFRAVSWFQFLNLNHETHETNQIHLVPSCSSGSVVKQNSPQNKMMKNE